MIVRGISEERAGKCCVARYSVPRWREPRQVALTSAVQLIVVFVKVFFEVVLVAFKVLFKVLLVACVLLIVAARTDDCSIRPIRSLIDAFVPFVVLVPLVASEQAVNASTQAGHCTSFCGLGVGARPAEPCARRASKKNERMLQVARASSASTQGSPRSYARSPCVMRPINSF